MKKHTYSISDLQKMCAKMHNCIVSFIESEYVDLYTKCTFLDKEFGSWISIPYNVILRGTLHPKRSKLKQRKTCLEKHGVEYANSSDVVKAKKKQTYNERYGCDHYFQTQEFLINVKRTWFEKYGVEHPQKSKIVRSKTERTCIEKYGVKAPYLTKEVLEKAHATQRTDEYREKIRKANIEKYGVADPRHQKWVVEKQWSKESRARRDATNISRYGVKSAWQRPGFQRSHPKINGIEAQRKRCETMKRNKSYGKSIPEDETYNVLCEIYGLENVERQKLVHKWPIDFYINSVDVYIQYDGYWHGVGRSIEEVANYRTKHDVTIHRKMLIDIEQNEYFAKANMKWFVFEQRKITYEDNGCCEKT